METMIMPDMPNSGAECSYLDVRNEENIVYIDLRSPVEFNESRIPGAINIPIFTDEERVIIGTLYRKHGEKSARWKAMEIVSPKIPMILSKIKKQIHLGLTPVLYCWRGGMRSKSVTYFAKLAGLEVKRLDGGYRAYRAFILDESERILPKKAVVLHGMTGVGKTVILNQLADMGVPVVDLERAANHKGSKFGAFGMGEAHSQKMFDSLLHEQILRLNQSHYFVVEAESKRVGKSSVPEYLRETVNNNAAHILVKQSVDARVDRIYDEYVLPLMNAEGYHSQVEKVVLQICKRISDKDILATIHDALVEKDYKTIVKMMMVHYYDPRYDYKTAKYSGETLTIESDDLNEIRVEIQKMISALHE